MTTPLEAIAVSVCGPINAAGTLDAPADNAGRLAFASASDTAFAGARTGSGTLPRPAGVLPAPPSP